MTEPEPTLSREEVVLAMQNLLVDIATGGVRDDAEYQPLRQRLLEDPVVSPFLPSYLKTCRSARQFWAHIKKTQGYQPRRDLLWSDFNRILNAIDRKTPADDAVSDALKELDPEHVDSIWQRALDRRATDPEAAITSARTLLETTCKHILDKTGTSYDDRDELPQLYRTTARALQLAPDQHTEQVFRQILGGCQAVVEGLGAVRNKLSDAHGRGKKSVKPAPRHAELAVNLAGAMAMFLVQTWSARKGAA